MSSLTSTKKQTRRSKCTGFTREPFLDCAIDILSKKGAKVIGPDVLLEYTPHSPRDVQTLAKAIQKAGSLILDQEIDHKKKLLIPLLPISQRDGSGVGFVNLPKRKGEQVICKK